MRLFQMLWAVAYENVFDLEHLIQQMAFRESVKLDEGNIGWG